jgi:cbb3-type cytochrome oxidase maturation protein
MDIVYLLIPLSLVLALVIIAALWWAVQTGQFDDLEGPASRILMEDEVDPGPPR